MSGNPVLAGLGRFILLAALQVLVLARVGMGEEWALYLQPLLYPLVVLLLPLGMPTPLVLFVAFALGTSVDVPLGTYGVHTGALLVTAFSRGAALAIVEPREGYSIGQSPTRAQFGWRWFLGYAAILMAVHTFTFFAIEVFTFVYFSQIILRALGSFCVSMILVLVYMVVFDPRV